MGVRSTEGSQVIRVEVKNGRGQKPVRGGVVGTSDGFVCVLLNNGGYWEIPEPDIYIVE